MNHFQTLSCVHYTIFLIIKLDLFIRALLLDRILALEKIIRAPRVHLVINKGVWIGYDVVLTYAGAFGYAYNVALVALSLSSLKQMIKNCEQFAESHSITFNPTKTKLLFFNMKPESVFPPIYLNGERVSIVEHEKHLGNYVASDIADRNLIANVCDLYQRSNVYCLAILE